MLGYSSFRWTWNDGYRFRTRCGTWNTSFETFFLAIASLKVEVFRVPMDFSPTCQLEMGMLSRDLVLA